MVPGANWVRVPDGTISSNATSGLDSWFSYDPPFTATAALKTAAGIALPAGQKSYLWFKHWRLLDFDNNGFYDGGTVDVDDLATPAGAVDAAALPWINGPSQTLTTPNTGKKAFGGTSFGWVASRVDLSSYAGKTVKPQFTMRTDSTVEYYGWFLDDIRVFTCASPFSAPQTVSATGGLGSAKVTWTPPATGAALVTGYRITQVGGAVRTTGAAARSLTVTGLSGGTNYTFKVQATGAGGAVGPAASVIVSGTKLSLALTKVSTSTKVSGKLTNVGGVGLSGKPIKIQRLVGGAWTTIATLNTATGGTYTKTVAGAGTAPIRVVFGGGVKLMGATSPQKHL